MMEEMVIAKILKNELKQLQLDYWSCENEKMQEAIQGDMELLVDAIVKLKNGNF